MSYLKNCPCSIVWQNIRIAIFAFWATDTFQLLEHTAEVVQLSDAAFQTDLLDAFVGKQEHTFRMGDPHLLQVSDQRHTRAVC